MRNCHRWIRILVWSLLGETLVLSPNLAWASVGLSSFSVGATPVPPAPQTWTPLLHPAPFAASTALLLTDGTVMVQQSLTSNWWQLKPDPSGNYIDGSWSQLASMPSNYAPLYYASAVLPDGRVVIEGGEYNNGTNGASQSQSSAPLPPPYPASYSSGPQAASETNLGAIYDPVANAWTPVAPPFPWADIRDAASVVLSGGTFMLAGVYYDQHAFLDATNLTWTVTTPSNKADSYFEEGWTLLPDGTVLTVDAHLALSSELYTASTDSWASGGSTVANLADLAPCDEIGPAVLRPDGTVFAIGATNHTAVYDTANGQWSAGPSMPAGLGVADGPAAPLPNGDVLFQASPTSNSNCYVAGSEFFLFDGTTLTTAAAPPQATSLKAYEGRMLVLPTGQILFTDGSSDVEVYTPAGTYQAAWRPTISSVPTTLSRGTGNYLLVGTQLNGRTQGAMYGDDAQMASNYPLVRITNTATGDVQYARTHDFSTMAVATGSNPVSARFDVPGSMEAGPSTLTVVANGIPSLPTNVNIVSVVPICAPDGIFCDGFE